MAGDVIDSRMRANKWLDEFETLDIEEADALDASESAQKDTSSEGESFEDLFQASIGETELKEGSVVQGTVIDINDDFVTVDVGYKSEGLIPSSEFRNLDGKMDLELNQKISVYLDRMEDENGHMVLSKDKAEAMQAWDSIAASCEKNEAITGVVVAKVRGGLSVDIGVKAFLPGSQLDIRPVNSVDQYIGKRLSFKVIKFNKRRGNIVLSRKALLLKEREKMREETLEKLMEGQIVQGLVKNITDYGAFIDLGGIDGLLHITDMSWGRIKHPSEVLSVGEEITVKVLKYDKGKGRVSLGLKQVKENPWEQVAEVYHIGDKVKGKVVSMKDYGAFVEIEDGVEGLIHVSEMSWTHRVKHPSKVLSVDEEVECRVLDVDTKNQRISLGLKQLKENPWDVLEQKFPVGSTVEGEVRNIADFGVFVDIGEGVDGLIHVSDISWSKKISHPSEVFEKNQKIKAVVLSVDKETEKFSLGVKQLERNPWEDVKSRYKIGQIVEGVVSKKTSSGVVLEIEAGLEGSIKSLELSSDGEEREGDAAAPEDTVKEGDTVRAQILSIDPRNRKITLSVKALEKSEERKNLQAYMDSKEPDSQTLGDVIGSQLKNISTGEEGKEEN